MHIRNFEFENKHFKKYLFLYFRLCISFKTFFFYDDKI